MHVLTRMNVGGPARAVIELARGLPPGFEVRVAAGRAPSIEGELEDPALAVEHVPLVRAVSPLRDVAAFLELRRLLGASRALVVHTHMAKAGALGRLAAASLRPRPAIVHTFHGHVLHGYFPAPVQSGFVMIERSLAHLADALVAVSPEIRDELLDLGVGRPGQWHVIPLGFDLSRFASLALPGERARGAEGPSRAEPVHDSLRARFSIPDAVPLVGAVARLAPVKDHATLLEAFARLPTRVARPPGLTPPEAHLVMIGDGDCREALGEQARRLGVEARVHFAGWCHDMPATMSELDLVVLSSRSEGTPAALIEAGAAGLPVVATRVGGVPSVVEDQVTGLLVPPGDAEQMARAMALLLGDPARCRQMGEAARERALGRFGEGSFVEAHRVLYTDLLEHLGAPGQP